MNYIVGLGNPDEQYEGTRHNVGRDVVMAFAKKFKFDDFEYDNKLKAQISEGEIGSGKKAAQIVLIMPDTYMNNSGASLKKYITSTKKAANMIVIHDDLDMGIGSMKIVFGHKSAGHRGVDSVIKTVKTKEFPRLKVGISPVTASGKIKKPKGSDAVIKHVLGKFGRKDETAIKKVIKKAVDALEATVVEGYMRAMNQYN